MASSTCTLRRTQHAESSRRSSIVSERNHARSRQRPESVPASSPSSRWAGGRIPRRPEHPILHAAALSRAHRHGSHDTDICARWRCHPLRSQPVPMHPMQSRSIYGKCPTDAETLAIPHTRWGGDIPSWSLAHQEPPHGCDISCRYERGKP